MHVFFDDVTDPGPPPTVAAFNETDIATLDRAQAHTVRLSIDFKPGPANGVLKITGTTWEDYYRYYSEQTGNGNVVPVVRKRLFRESGMPDPTNAGNGFLVDGVSLASSTVIGPPTSADECKDGGWQKFDNPSFKNQGECASYLNSQGTHAGGNGYSQGHHD